MNTVSVTLKTTEVIDGEKRVPGDTVELPENDPIAIKTLDADRKAEKAEDDARRD